MKTTRYKMICGALIGCLTLLLAGLAFAQPPEKPDPVAMEKHLQDQLVPLLANQTVTADQAEKILDLFRQKGAERQAEQEKIRQMSPEDRDTYLKERCQERCSQSPPNFVKDLTEIVGLSSEQAKTVADALRPPHPPDGKAQGRLGKPDPAAMEKHLRSQLDQLVSSNALSQAQADKIAQFFRQKGAERQAEQEKIRQMSPTDRDAYMKQHCQERCSNRPDPAKELAGIAGLSIEQAKTVADALRPPHHPAPPDGGGKCPPPPPAGN